MNALARERQERLALEREALGAAREARYGRILVVVVVSSALVGLALLAALIATGVAA